MFVLTIENLEMMETINVIEINDYLLGFCDTSPDNRLNVEYDIEGWYDNKHRIIVTVKSKTSTISVTFHHCNMWGYVVPLGVCLLNGKETKLNSIIGEYAYSKNESSLLNITLKLMKIA